MHMYRRNSSRSGARFTFIDLAVAEEFRRRGIATGLINKLREIAREKGGG